MMNVSLTLGMACFRDYAGVWSTVTALCYYHRTVMPQCEILVVDNCPDSPEGESVKRFIENWGNRGCAAVRYIPFPRPIGTAAPRQQVFDQGQGEWRFCMDSHIFWEPNSVARLLEFLKTRPAGDRNLYSGYMLYDDLRLPATNFTPDWGGAMEGKWHTHEHSIEGSSLYSEEPWEIEAMGLGLFGCHKDAFPGFNPRFRGFGGEEWYIHRKVRRNGGKCITLPWLKWPHRFGHPSGCAYPNVNESKLRNFIIGHRELGVPLERCRRHFVEGYDEQLLKVDPDFPRISQQTFDAIVRDVDEYQDDRWETIPMAPSMGYNTVPGNAVITLMQATVLPTHMVGSVHRVSAGINGVDHLGNVFVNGRLVEFGKGESDG